MGYADYLRSDHWIATRKRKLEAAGARCERCGEYARRLPGGLRIGLHVHHLTYERIGREDLDDLEVLCIYCHECEHGTNTRTREQIRAALAAKVLEHAPDDIDLELAAWDALAEAAGM